MEQTAGVQGNGQGTFYDYKNRDYDPWNIRFKRTDPIAAKFPMLSPFQFASNRPIDGIDLDGLEFEKYQKLNENNVLEEGWRVRLTYSIENGYKETQANEALEEIRTKLNANGFDVIINKSAIDETTTLPIKSIYHITFDGEYMSGRGVTAPGSNTQRGLFTISPLAPPRTALHELLAHGGGLEHINVVTSILYPAYQYFMSEYPDRYKNGPKEIAKLFEKGEIKQLLENITNTVEVTDGEKNTYPSATEKLGLDAIHRGNGDGILPAQIKQLKDNIINQTPERIPSRSPNEVKPQ